jgi:hypothetical protein
VATGLPAKRLICFCEYFFGNFKKQIRICGSLITVTNQRSVAHTQQPRKFKDATNCYLIVKNMSTSENVLNLNDRQAMEICDTVGRTLVDELDNKEVWGKIEQVLFEYIKNNNIDADATELTDRVEWSVKVNLRK